MKLSIIKKLLESKITPIEFKTIILPEVIEFTESSKKKGSSTPIYLDEDCNLDIGKIHAIMLLKLYKQNMFDEYFIGYIVDALLLSEKVHFESESFLELFETLTDPEINGNLNIARANQLLEEFQGL